MIFFKDVFLECPLVCDNIYYNTYILLYLYNTYKSDKCKSFQHPKAIIPIFILFMYLFIFGGLETGLGRHLI